MQVLVTGGAGFIGSHVVDLLCAGGHQLVVVDDLSTGRAGNLAGHLDGCRCRLDLHQLDLRAPAVAALVARRRPEAVLHLAAQLDVGVSVADPVRDADVNLLGTLRLLEACTGAGVRKLVFASSGGTIYGDVPAAALPVAEDHPKHPVSPYGISKLAVGHYLRAYRRLRGLDSVALALGNVYGPRQQPGNESGVVCVFARAALDGTPVEVWGSGRQTRDFVAVADVARAFALALRAGAGLVNIGTGVETSVLGVAAAVGRAVGRPLAVRHLPGRPGDVGRIALSPRRAARQLGWAATVPLDEGVRRVVEWLRPAAA